MPNATHTAAESRRAIKCPTKKTINLAQRESQSRNITTLAVGIALIAVLCLCVAKFAVLDQLERQRKAESDYAAVHSQYSQMQKALEEYPQVEEEYRTYSRKWVQAESNSRLFVSVDRQEVLDLLETWLMPYGEIRSFNVQDDTLVINMSGMNLEEISAMFERVQQQPIVKSAALNLASTAKETETGHLDFSLTIVLQPAKEETAQ